MKFPAIFSMLSLLFIPPTAATAQKPADIPRLYAEIAGDYEFYADQQYVVLGISVEKERLWGRQGGKSQELRPVDLAQLRFKVEDPAKEQFAVFVRDKEGRISAIRLITGPTESAGVKIPAGGRKPRPVDEPFPAEDLRSDLLQVRRGLEEIHPAVHGYIDKAAFEGLYRRQLARIDGPKTLGEFYRIAAPLVAAVGCVHTALSAPGDFWSAAPPRFFPLRIAFFGGRAYALPSKPSSDQVLTGSEILSINGRDISAISQDLKSLVSSDGGNDGYKTAVIGAIFAKLYAVQYGFPGEFEAAILPPGRTTAEKVRLRPVALSEIPADPSAENTSTSSGDPNLDFKILPGDQSLAVMTISSFDYYTDPERAKFKGFIDAAFGRIREAGIRRLILDLRSNGGGDPFCTTHLLSYLEPRPVPYFARSYPAYERLAEPIPRAGKAFEGKLFVLIDAGCLSSTGHFCGVLRFHKIGTFIGTETGATYECNDARRLIQLEKTRFRLFVARMTFTAAVQGLPRYQGIVPDIAVVPGLDDVLSGRDPVMERARLFIARDEGTK